MNSSLSNSDIKYINKMIHQLDNYDKKTIDTFFNKINKSLNKISDNELNDFYKTYFMNIKNSSTIISDKKINLLFKKAKRKSKINNLKEGFLDLYDNVSKRLYKSDIKVIKTIAELSFVYLIFIIYSVYIGSSIISFNKVFNIMTLSIGAYTFCRILSFKGKEDDIKLCNFVEKISMLFLRIAFFIGLGDFAIKYVFIKSLYDLCKIIYIGIKKITK